MVRTNIINGKHWADILERLRRFEPDNVPLLNSFFDNALHHVAGEEVEGTREMSIFKSFI
jgi:hypothetical protein